MPAPAKQAAAHRAAVSLATPGGFAPALAQALAALLPELGLANAQRLIAGRETEQILDSLNWEAFEAQLQAAASSAAATMSPALMKSALGPLPAIDLSPETLARFSDELAAKHAAEFVTAIGERDRKALRSTIRKAVRRQGVHRRLLAREIRGQIGLNLPQQRSFAKQSAKWLDQVAAGSMTRRRYAQRIDRLHRRMIRQRSNLIAGHEARSIAQRAQQKAYQAARDNGVPIVGVDGVFVGRNGATSSGPPLHINCNCTTTTVIRDGVLRILWVAGPEWCEKCDPFNRVLKGEGRAVAPESPEFTGRRREEIARLEDVARAAVPRPTAGQPRPRSAAAQERRFQRDRQKLASAWVHGSRNVSSTHMQVAAQEEFGLDVAVWNKRGHTIRRELVDRYRPVVRRMYEETQEALRLAGVEEVELLRGLKSDVSVRGVLEAWTTSGEIAEKFDGYTVLRQRIAARDVFLYRGGPGWVDGRFGNQEEWVLLGRI